MCKDYDEYFKLRNLQKEFETEHASLVSKISSDIDTNTLKADQVIEELFAKSKQIETGDELLNVASVRVNIGNPPGKNGSLGDAINWEALLSEVPDGEDLYLIADDRDYFSALDENKPKEFLVREWKEKKSSEVNFYRRISPFFKVHYPDIKLASELEKELAVQKLVSSRAFVTTHSAVAKLTKFEDLSEAQVKEIVDAALTNNQVNWIIGDTDVFEFLSKLVDEYKDKIDADALDQLSQKLQAHAPKQEAEDDFPF